MGRTVRIATRIFRYVIAAGYAHDAGLALWRGWVGGDGLSRRVGDGLAANDIPEFYRSFLNDVVLAHDQVFTALVLVGSLALIVGLIAGGRLAVPAALLSLFLQVNYTLLDGPASVFDVVFVVIEIAIIVLAIVERRRMSMRVSAGMSDGSAGAR